MRSQKHFRLQSSKNIPKNQRQGSYSPKLSTSVSDKCLWIQSYKNEPIPRQLKRRLLSHVKKTYFETQSDDEEDIMPVQQQDENQINQKQVSKLPRYKVVGDWDQFSQRTNRIRSQKQEPYSSKRSRSVESLKLPQVLEDKKEDDQLNRLQLSKLSQVKDQNQFNQKNRISQSSYTDGVQSTQFNQFNSGLPDQIPEMQAQQVKSVKLSNQKSIITTELEKLIVDQIDDKKKRKEELEEQIESIIEEKNQQKNQQQEINTERLRQSLQKFDTQYQYLKMHADQIPYNIINEDIKQESDQFM